jgi:glycine cleavage system H protein
MNSWAQADRGGTVRLGVTGIFSGVLGPIDNIELPEVNDEIRQGSLLAHVVTRDELRHAVWSALSGRVLELNPAIEKDCEAVQRDPSGEGWLVRIVPEDLEGELGNLSAGVG